MLWVPPKLSTDSTFPETQTPRSVSRCTTCRDSCRAPQHLSLERGTVWRFPCRIRCACLLRERRESRSLATKLSYLCFKFVCLAFSCLTTSSSYVHRMYLNLSRGVGKLPLCLYSERSCPSGALTGYRPHGYFSGVLPRAASAGSGAPPLIQNLGKLGVHASRSGSLRNTRADQWVATKVSRRARV